MVILPSSVPVSLVPINQILPSRLPKPIKGSSRKTSSFSKLRRMGTTGASSTRVSVGVVERRELAAAGAGRAAGMEEEAGRLTGPFEAGEDADLDGVAEAGLDLAGAAE